MNKGRHTSYQYRIGNRKGGSNTVGSRPWLGYMTPLQCLSYKGPKGGGQRNKIYSGQFPYLQGHLAPQAGYTTLFARVDAHVHCCIAATLCGIHLLIPGFARATPLLGPDGGSRCTGRLWLPRASLY